MWWIGVAVDGATLVSIDGINQIYQKMFGFWNNNNTLYYKQHKKGTQIEFLENKMAAAVWLFQQGHTKNPPRRTTCIFHKSKKCTVVQNWCISHQFICCAEHDSNQT